ncbi:MAG: hypothetical protein ACK5L5_11915 [Bacteroidales bacterium]
MKNQKRISNTAELKEEIARLKAELGLASSGGEKVGTSKEGHATNDLSSYLKGSLVSDLLKANAFGLSKLALKYSKSLMSNRKFRKGMAITLLSAGAVMVIRSMFEKDAKPNENLEESTNPAPNDTSSRIKNDV